MNQSYDDIRDKLGEPLWWDECGVPRYCEMAPSKVNDIYADEVAFVKIACQSCGKRFKVAISSHGIPSLARLLRELGCIHYGDPPNIRCCPAGPTMSSDPIRVIQFWQRNLQPEWVRVPELEREMDE